MPSQPTFAESFRFPVATREARHDLAVGGALLLTTLPGWILNLGHRLEVVHRIWHGETPMFRGFSPVWFTFRRGLVAFACIAVYLSPAAICGILGLWLPAAALFLVGVFVLPGGMTRNAVYRDTTYLLRPDRAMRVAIRGGRRYLKAWLIAGCAIALSLLGLVGCGLGFLWTSVWAWSVVGHAFTRALQEPIEGS